MQTENMTRMKKAGNEMEEEDRDMPNLQRPRVVFNLSSIVLCCLCIISNKLVS